LQQLWRKAKAQAVLKSIEAASNKKAGRLKHYMFSDGLYAEAETLR
jgi:hypothetical protein